MVELLDGFNFFEKFDTFLIVFNKEKYVRV